MVVSQNQLLYELRLVLLDISNLPRACIRQIDLLSSFLENI
jgi:hypothetical protein